MLYLDFAGEENKTKERDIRNIIQLLTDICGSISGICLVFNHSAFNHRNEAT